MGGSGLIVVVIVAAWALFLVPQWMHRRASAAAHLADRVPDVVDRDDDEHSEPAPSRRRFGRRHLTRRSPARAARSQRWRVPDWVSRRGDAAGVETGHSASHRRHLPTDRHAAKEDVVTPAAHSSEARPHRSPRTAAARRRRLLGVLAALTLVAALAVGIGALANLPVPPWLVAIPGGLMVAYLVLLAVVRPGARQASRPLPEVSSRHLDDERSDEPGLAGEDHRSRPVPRPRELATVGAGPADAAVVAPPSTFETVQPEGSAEAATPEDSSTWTPVPVPTPTYVTAPRARRAVRTIDLSNPGSWTAASSSAPRTTIGPASAAGDSAEAEAQDEYVVEHRRAVGD